MNRAILRRKLSDEVLVRLEDMVRSGEYPVGSSLPSERELMTMYEVGRPSVREALHALATKGLVRINSGERPKVTRPTPHGMLEHLSGAARLLLEQAEGLSHFEQLRLFLEEGIARHAARHATERQRAALCDALDANERAIPRARAFADTDVAFHRVLMEVPGNPIFTAVHEALVDWLIGQRTPLADEAGNRRSFEGHRRVLHAIGRGDAEGAGQAMREHLEAAQRRFASRAGTAPAAPEAAGL